MPKFKIKLQQSVLRYAEVEVEAEDADAAWEMEDDALAAQAEAKDLWYEASVGRPFMYDVEEVD